MGTYGGSSRRDIPSDEPTRTKDGFGGIRPPESKVADMGGGTYKAVSSNMGGTIQQNLTDIPNTAISDETSRRLIKNFDDGYKRKSPPIL